MLTSQPIRTGAECRLATKHSALDRCQGHPSGRQIARAALSPLPGTRWSGFAVEPRDRRASIRHRPADRGDAPQSISLPGGAQFRRGQDCQKLTGCLTYRKRLFARRARPMSRKCWAGSLVRVPPLGERSASVSEPRLRFGGRCSSSPSARLPPPSGALTARPIGTLGPRDLAVRCLNDFSHSSIWLEGLEWLTRRRGRRRCG